MRIIFSTLLLLLCAALTHANPTLSATQIKISKTYQAITELDRSIQKQTNTVKQLQTDIDQLSQNIKNTKEKLKISNNTLNILKLSSQVALNKLYHLSFSDKSTDQIYLTHYSKKVIAQHTALQKLKKEQEMMIQQQAHEQKKHRQFIKKHTELNEQLLHKKSKLESEVAALQSLLADTLKTAHQKQNTHHTSQLPIANAKGKLPWPLSGHVRQHFGSALYDSQLKAEAILIEPTNHHVKAVYAGKIIYADWLPAYGYLVIIDHGNQYHTLYGHLDHTTVVLNQTVTSGEVIGEVHQDNTQHKQLFFSIKHRLIAQDPEQWLSSSTSQPT